MENNDNRKKVGGGIGFTSALAILFIALKLTHVIAWPWKWVLAPIWLPWLAALIIFVVCLVISKAMD